MNKFTIFRNHCLSIDVEAFYHCDYTGMRQPNNPDFINVIKNDFGRGQIYGIDMTLNDACDTLKDVLLEDLPQIVDYINEENLYICAIPRAKAENTYSPKQLLLKKTISDVCDRLRYNNGTCFIKRVVDTQTTHLKFASCPNFGESPRKGITKDTCQFSPEIQGKTILLIDDIYTKTVNIDEDCLQALLDMGASKVYFYSIGKTISRY